MHNIGDAILPWSGKNDQKRGSKFGALLWPHLTLQRKTAIQVHNYNPSCIQLLKKDSGKFTYCMTFGAHKLVHSQPSLDYRYEIWHLLSALCSDVQKFFLYRCTSTVSALNYCSRIFSKSFSYLYEVVRRNFSADFLDFRNFWPQFCDNCGAT